MKYIIRNSFILGVTLLSFGISQQALAQAQVILGQDESRRVITTAVPFLAISPDSRASGMGDVGVATSPDANATHWNPAKLAYLEPSFGISGSFTPWLSKVINDMSISYLSAYKKINQQQALGFSMRYFDLGDIQLTDQQGNLLNLVSPREFSLAATFALQLGENLSAGLTGRFIHSNLLSGTTSAGGNDGQAGMTGAADVGIYYTKDIVFNGREGNWSFGANISNIGAKITYLSEDQADFIPTNLRLGGAFTTYLDPYNKLTFALDFNKLLVPTPPVYERDSITGGIVFLPNGQPSILRGKDPNRGLLSGMFGSFADAPDGFSEEMQEIMIGAGVEYWYNDLFAVRAGYFYENANKGNRKYFTAGLGLRYQVFGVDFAYLLPQQQNHPLQETLRISLHFDIDSRPTESIGEESDLN